MPGNRSALLPRGRASPGPTRHGQAASRHRTRGRGGPGRVQRLLHRPGRAGRRARQGRAQEPATRAPALLLSAVAA